MHYVYLIESTAYPEHRYVGLTSDLKRRLAEHNSGQSSHTAKHRPWRLVTYLAFTSLGSAAKFERYLTSGSGHAFAKKRLWSSKLDPDLRFRKQVCRNAYMKAALKQAQHDVCPVCTMPLWNRLVVIHHRDYLHKCEWAGTIFVKAAGTDVEAPDCADCAKDSETRFTACRERLQLLHRGCHAKHHAGIDEG